GVTRRLLDYASLQHGLADGSLDDRLVQMVTAALAGVAVHVEARRGEHPLPGPLATRIRILPGERPWQLDPAGAVAEVALMERAHSLEMLREVALDRGRKHRQSVLAALAAADRD